MLEDIDFEKLYELLDQVPDLIKNSKKQDLRDNANAKKFKEIKDDVSEMKTELSSFKTVLMEAKAAFQEPVKIQDKNIHITKDDIQVTQSTPEWVQSMGDEYQEIKKKELSRKQRKIVKIGGPRFSTFLACIFFVVIMVGVALFLIANSISKNSVEAYAKRAYQSAVQCHFEDPGGFYDVVIKNWNDEAEIEKTKMFVDNCERRAKKVKELEDSLSVFCKKEVLVKAYENKGDEYLVTWYCPEEEPDMIAHLSPDGKIKIADASKIKVTSIEDAHRLSRHKAWSTIREATTTEPTE